jgi:protein SCO1
MAQLFPVQLRRLGHAVSLAASLLGFALVLAPPETRDRAFAAVSGQHPLDFTLHSARGPVDTKTLRGAVVLVYFGYTACPDVCPTTLSDVAAALRSLGPAAEKVRVLFVSVDPARDTPARLAEYAAYFDPRIVGLTGSIHELTATATRYGASFGREPAGEHGDYTVFHSGSIYVRNQLGELEAKLDHGSSPDTIAGVLRKLLTAPTR